MAHPARVEKAEAIAIAVGDYVKAYVDAKVHMATNDQPLYDARTKLAELLAAAIK